MKMKVQLHCIARIHVVYLKEVDLLASLMVQSSSRQPPFSSVHRDKM
uniref:Ycf15 n=2 Tax=Eurycorymbus cavaleriei TaxID=325641 RepID=A0A8E5J7L9_9ROSI|nr:Ycf15 [Eurycorymbus cavaleriei]QUX33597.1 Ycf15 [Eurycorymbus cavaleriei]